MMMMQFPMAGVNTHTRTQLRAHNKVESAWGGGLGFSYRAYG
jgi:hypothetical protein